MHKHLEQHDILTSLQHGLRSRRSCETQLLVTLFDLLSLRDTKVQVNVLVLDFSKAFDTVPRDHLMGKLEHYGISGPILNWINVFMKIREQRVQVDGAFSSSTSVDSGVPKGTALGPLLFLLHINDLPQVVSSQVRLFADDCLLYRGIRCREDQLALQRDLTTHSKWGDTWGMKFSAANCKLCVSPAHRPLIPSFIALTTRSLPRSTRLNISGSHYPTSLAGPPVLVILSVRPTPPWASSDAIYAAVLRH